MTYSARTAPLPRGYGFTPYQMDSVSSCSAIAAASGRTITYLTATQLPQGFYEVSVKAQLVGNTAVTDLNGMVLQNGVTTITALLVSSNTAVDNRFYLSLSGTDSLAVVANYGATAATAYTASITATAVHPGA